MKKFLFALTVCVCGLLVATEVKAVQKQTTPSAVKRLRTVSVTKNSVELKWNASRNASGYIVFQYRPSSGKYKKIASTKKKTYTVKKGLKKNSTAKFMVQAYQQTENGRVYSPCSRKVSVCLLESKKKNVEKVQFLQDPLTVEEGALFSLNTKITPKKNVVSKKVTFTSSNSNVVKVLAGGVLMAKKKGKVTITASAHNGIAAKTTLWILEKDYDPMVHTIKSVKNLRVQAVDGNTLKLTWNKCGYVDGYQIYQYNYDKQCFTFFKTVKGKEKTSVKITELNVNTNYMFCIKGYKNKKGVHVFGTVSRAASGCVQGGIYVNASSIRFGSSEYTVMEDGKLKLDCIVSPENVISGNVTYESSKEEIATVSADGTVTGHEVGKTYITAYSHNGLSIRVPVRVVENSKYASRISVLCFHRVVSDKLKKSKFSQDEWVAAVSDFEKQMKYLYDNHYTTLSLDEFYNWHRGKSKVPSKSIVLTFDDGDYEFYYLIYPILKKYKFKANMFIVGNRTGETTEEYKDEAASYYLGWDKINEMKADYPNITFQSHTYGMHYAKLQLAVYELSLAQVYEDFEINDEKGKEHNNTYQYMAYPFGGFTDDVEYCAKKYNYKLAFDFALGRKATRDDSIYHIPRWKINGEITLDNFKKRI